MVRVSAWWCMCLSLLFGCGAGAADMVETVPSSGKGGYALESVPSRLGDLDARVEQGDEAAARERALFRADLLLIAQLTRRATLVRTLASSFGGAAERLCAEEPLAPGCIPTLYHLAGTELAQHEPERSRLFLSLSSGWDEMSGGVFGALRQSIVEEGAALEAADALSIAFGVEVVRAVESITPAAASLLFAQGYNLECPSAVGMVRDAAPQDRFQMLESAGCDASCRDAKHPLECPPDALGAGSIAERDFLAGNVPAWLVVRSVGRLAASHTRLAASDSDLARTLAREGVLGDLGDLFASLDLPLSPPSSWKTDEGVATVPTVEGILPWDPSPFYAIVSERGIALGRSPRLRIEQGAVRVVGTAMPGEVVPPEEEGALVLDGEPTALSRAWEAMAGKGADGASVVMLADEGFAARNLVAAAARFERELGVDVHLLLRAAHTVGVLRIPSAPDPTKGGPTQASSARRLHLTDKGFRVTASLGQVSGEDSTEPSALASVLEQAARGVPPGEPLTVSVGEGVSYARLIEALKVAGGRPEAPFRALRLSP